MSEHLAEVTIEEKQKALSSVLHSDVLARGDQLKSFLKYVCEMEIAGRTEEISEYLVGVEALGKPHGFSTAEDASVRNRAYALRQKLEKYYQEEAPNSPIRIEFIKGTYVPRFVEVNPSERRASARPAPAPLPVKTGRFPFSLNTILTLLAGVAVGITATLLLTAKQANAPASARIDPVVREAWGPLLDPSGNVLICLGTAAQLTLLPFDVEMEWRPKLPVFKAPAELHPWYVRHHRYYSGENLYMSPDVNSPHFGDVLGATVAIKTLAAARCGYQLLPERVVQTATLNARNSILFGVPHKSEAIFKLLQTGRFQFGYDPKLRDVTISQNVGGSPRVFAPKRDERNDRIESFGLITVTPVDLGGGSVGRSVAFSGDPSAGAAAAAEFFSSSEYLAAFRQKLKAEGYSRFPAAYQVLIRCKLDSNLLNSFAYEAHAVLRKE